MKYYALGLAVAILNSCAPDGPPPEYIPEKPKPAPTGKISYRVVKRLPHDQEAFTQGLLFHKGKLYESTGSPDNMRQTRSTLGIVNLETGDLDVKAELDRDTYFGEGLAELNGRLYWVTWKNQACFVYDANTFKRIGQFSYPNREGWGLTVHDSLLVMSDGTYNLTYFDPKDFSVVKTLAVTKDGYGLDNLNELEMINGYIYANVWMSHIIVKIDPSNGKVVGELDLSDLYKEAADVYPRLSETNGIAYDPDSNRVLVTGKLWPQMYQIEFDL